MSINFLPLFRDNSVAKSTQNGKLINTSSENFAESPGLQHWAEIENLKIAASTYANAKSISALEQQVAERRTISTTARSALVTLEHEMKPFAELINLKQISLTMFAPKNQKIQTSISEGTKANCFYMTVQKMYFKKPE